MESFLNRVFETLRLNRPDWNVVEVDVRDFSAKEFKGVDLLAGGVPCAHFPRSASNSFRYGDPRSPFSVDGRELFK